MFHCGFANNQERIVPLFQEMQFPLSFQILAKKLGIFPSIGAKGFDVLMLFCLKNKLFYLLF